MTGNDPRGKLNQNHEDLKNWRLRKHILLFFFAFISLSKISLGAFFISSRDFKLGFIRFILFTCTLKHFVINLIYNKKLLNMKVFEF